MHTATLFTRNTLKPAKQHNCVPII